MSSTTREASVRDGAPVDLFKFDQGNAPAARYTDADTVIAYNGDTYAPAAITRGNIKTGDGTAGWEVDITLPVTDPLALLFRGLGTPLPIFVTIYRLHRGETDAWPIFPAGKVRGASYADEVCTLHCTDLEADLDLEIPATTMQRNCPWMLYGARCGAVAADFRTGFAVSAVVLNADGTQTLTCDLGGGGFPADYYTAGLADLGDPALPSFIAAQPTSSSVTVMVPLDVAPGGTVFLTAGCDRTSDDCQNKFHNIEHFGGFPGLPAQNPYAEGGLR